MAGDSRMNLAAIRVGFFCQQRMSTHQEAGRTKSALNGMMGLKGFLNRVQRSRRLQSFHGENLPAVELGGEHQAGINRLSIHHNGASPTLTNTTPFLGSL